MQKFKLQLLYHTDNRSLAYSSSSGHRSIGRNRGRCGKCSLSIGISFGHWLECGVPINLQFTIEFHSLISIQSLGQCACLRIYVKIFSNWLRSDVPGNKARRENNSAIIQAELHMSTALLYDWFNNTSGARYHNVTTLKTIDRWITQKLFTLNEIIEGSDAMTTDTYHRC